MPRKKHSADDVRLHFHSYHVRAGSPKICSSMPLPRHDITRIHAAAEVGLSIRESQKERSRLPPAKQS